MPNTDLHPGAVLHTAAALAREEDARFLSAAIAVAPAMPYALVALAAIGALFARRGGLAAFATATAGGSSMGLWIVLLLVYQARVGALYADFALFSGAFMAGVAAGARIRARLAAVEAAFLLAALLVLLALTLAGRVTLLLLAILVGAAGGATLGNAVAAHPGAATRLYAWDLAGAAGAALCFGGFLLPAVGAPLACATVAAIKLVSLATILAKGRG